jgi:mRNA-degrading endonuclease RelE of RelBE toxin-antitoxin system
VPDFAVLYHRKVVSDEIPELDPAVRRRIKAAIEAKLLERPEDHAKPLAYTTERLWTLRVGDWRVVFAMRATELWVLKIGHRSEVYRYLSSRKVPRI